MDHFFPFSFSLSQSHRVGCDVKTWGKIKICVWIYKNILISPHMREGKAIIKIANEWEREKIYFYEVSKVNFSKEIKKISRMWDTSSFMLWQARQCHNTSQQGINVHVEYKRNVAKKKNISTSLTHQKSKHVFSSNFCFAHSWLILFIISVRESPNLILWNGKKIFVPSGNFHSHALLIISTHIKYICYRQIHFHRIVCYTNSLPTHHEYWIWCVYSHESNLQLFNEAKKKEYIFWGSFEKGNFSLFFFIGKLVKKRVAKVLHLEAKSFVTTEND